MLEMKHAKAKSEPPKHLGYQLLLKAQHHVTGGLAMAFNHLQDQKIQFSRSSWISL